MTKNSTYETTKTNETGFFLMFKRGIDKGSLNYKKVNGEYVIVFKNCKEANNFCDYIENNSITLEDFLKKDKDIQKSIKEKKFFYSEIKLNQNKKVHISKDINGEEYIFFIEKHLTPQIKSKYAKLFNELDFVGDPKMTVLTINDNIIHLNDVYYWYYDNLKNNTN